MSRKFTNSLLQGQPDPVLHIPLQQSNLPVDLVLHLQAALAVPVHTTLTCRAQPAPCSNQPLQQVRLLQQQGRVQILDLVRGGHGQRQPGQAPQQVLSAAVIQLRMVFESSYRS